MLVLAKYIFSATGKNKDLKVFNAQERSWKNWKERPSLTYAVQTATLFRHKPLAHEES